MEDGGGILGSGPRASVLFKLGHSDPCHPARYMLNRTSSAAGLGLYCPTPLLRAPDPLEEGFPTLSFPKHSDLGSAVLLLLPVLATPRAYSVSLPGSLKNPPTLTQGGISPLWLPFLCPL